MPLTECENLHYGTRGPHSEKTSRDLATNSGIECFRWWFRSEAIGEVVILNGMQIRFGDCIPLTGRRTIHPRCGVFLEYSRTQRKSLVLVAGPILSTERDVAVFWNIGFFSFYLHGPIVVKNADSASTARSTFRPLCRTIRALG